MIYSNAQETFRISSTWSCLYKYTVANPEGYWYIAEGPTAATKTVTFAVDLPSDAVIAKAWIGVTWSNAPHGGIKYRKMNGISIPSDGVVEINVDAGTTSYTAEFSYCAYGVVHEDISSHSGTLVFGTPTLYVDYLSASSGGTDPIPSASGAEEMRQPRLFDRDMQELRRLRCESASVTLNLDELSTASLRLMPGEEVSVDHFVEVFCPYGSAGIFRVAETDTAYKGSRGQSVNLEHGIATLADDLAVAGNVIQAPVAQVFSSLFSLQTRVNWILGDCDIPEDLELVFTRDYQSLYTAFTDLTSKLPEGYAWDYDQRSYPWVAHLRALPTEPESEFRLSRNIEGVTVSVDKSSQCTRLYPFGSGEGEERITLETLTGQPYLDADNVADAGVIAKTITNDDIFDALTLKDVAQRYLDRHKEPTFSVRLDGIDIHKATGLTLDKIQLGKICLVPMPVYGKTIRERVLSVSWRDAVKSPERISAVLANRIKSATDEIAELIRQSTSSKLLGGTVVTKDSTNSYNNVTNTAGLVHRFNIEGYGNVLSVRATWTPPTGCKLVVDSETNVPDDEATGSVDILRYLKRDENGVPITGEHWVTYLAKTSTAIGVSSTISIKSVEKES